MRLEGLASKGRDRSLSGRTTEARAEGGEHKFPEPWTALDQLRKRRGICQVADSPQYRWRSFFPKGTIMDDTNYTLDFEVMPNETD